MKKQLELELDDLPHKKLSKSEKQEQIRYDYEASKFFGTLEKISGIWNEKNKES